MNGFACKVSGIIEKGSASARKGGHPTANLVLEKLPEIAQGIYLGYATIEGGEEMPSIIFFGVPYALPNIIVRRFEVHLLEKNVMLYGQKLTVQLVAFIRENQKFENAESLSAAIEEDIKKAKEYFKTSS